MVAVLENELGIKTIAVDPVEGLHDMAFVCDPGLWIDDLFIAGNFWAKPRQPEVAHLEKWFKERGYEVAKLSASRRSYNLNGHFNAR